MSEHRQGWCYVKNYVIWPEPDSVYKFWGIFIDEAYFHTTRSKVCWLGTIISIILIYNEKHMFFHYKKNSYIWKKKKNYNCDILILRMTTHTQLDDLYFQPYKYENLGKCFRDLLLDNVLLNAKALIYVPTLKLE